MRFFIYLQFFVIFIVEYVVHKINPNFGLLHILPDIISLVAGVYVLVYFAIYKDVKIQWRYVLFSFALVVHLTIGIIGNQVQPLAVLAGLRNYFKFLPFFLIPLVYDQPDEAIKFQLKVLLMLAIMQVPLALYQRLFEYAGLRTGDYIAGTLTAAPILTLYLVAVISVLLGFYLKKDIAVNTFALLSFLLFVPTAINETKATVILLPIAFFIPAIFGVGKGVRLKIIATVIPIVLMMVVGFHFAYKSVYGERSDVATFFSSGQVQDYLYKGAKANQVTEQSETQVGRVDAIILSYKQVSKDFFTLIWGVGIGNAAVSFSNQFLGKYANDYLRLGGKQNSISNFIWEIGLLGVVHIIWLILLFFLDAYRLRKRKGYIGSLALGWLGVITIFAISLPYQNMITKNELIYPFFFISGLLAASAIKQEEDIEDKANKKFSSAIK